LTSTETKASKSEEKALAMAFEHARVKSVSLQEETEKRYLNYALSVITSRALPDVRDGLKPVQRRILYAMFHNLKLLPSAKFRKSAAVVGDVMGKYHPHGDQAIYDAMVRMAQPFTLRLPLVDGYGNFGSVDGDKAAAMRYTEARLQAAALELLDELKTQTVFMRPTFDGTQEEPVVLPARFPQLLVNGCAGIAVGMATNIPPHHLGEVMDALLLVLDEPNCTTAQILKKLKGPDFPTGGEIITPRKERIQIYEEGQGTIQVRGEWKEEIVQDAKKKLRRLIITSIPYAVSKASIVEKIAEVVVSKKIPGLIDVRDESTEEIRIVLELKPGQEADLVMAYLYKHTPLLQRFAVNLTALVPTPNPLVAAPAKLSIKAVFEQFLAFRFEILEKRLRCELERLQKRIHILEGFKLIFNDLDEAIRIIRQADGRKDSADKLRSRYGLTEEQAEAIVDLRLYRISRLEINVILDELAQLSAQAADIEATLASQPRMTALLRQEALEVAARYKDKRRTRILEEDHAPQYDPEAFIQDEDTHVVLSRDGWIKRIRTIHDPKAIRVREGDEILAILAGSTKESVCFFTNLGMAYTLRIWDVPATAGYGVPLQSLFKFSDGERVISATSLDPRLCGDIQPPMVPEGQEAIPPTHLFVATQEAQGSRLPLSLFQEPSNKTGRRFTRLNKGDQVIAACLTRSGDSVVLASQGLRYLFFPAEEVSFLSAPGKGVRLMALDEGDQIVGCAISQGAGSGLQLLLPDGKALLLAPLSNAMLAKRASKGTKKRDVTEWTPLHTPFLQLLAADENSRDAENARAPEEPTQEESQSHTQTEMLF
jgi:DNA gyrase subunit A